MDGGREGGTGCTTSCLDPLLPSSVHTVRHSEGHGCLWKCLCELLPGRKYLRSFSVWHQKAAGWIKQQLLSPVSSSTHSAPLSRHALLSAWSLATRHCSQKLEECVFISLLPSRKSPFMSIRGEFKFPRAAAAVVTLCVTVQNYHKNRQVTK